MNVIDVPLNLRHTLPQWSVRGATLTRPAPRRTRTAPHKACLTKTSPGHSSNRSAVTSCFYFRRQSHSARQVPPRFVCLGAPLATCALPLRRVFERLRDSYDLLRPRRSLRSLLTYTQSLCSGTRAHTKRPKLSSDGLILLSAVAAVLPFHTLERSSKPSSHCRLRRCRLRRPSVCKLQSCCPCCPPSTPRRTDFTSVYSRRSGGQRQPCSVQGRAARDSWTLNEGLEPVFGRCVGTHECTGLRVAGSSSPRGEAHLKLELGGCRYQPVLVDFGTHRGVLGVAMCALDVPAWARLDPQIPWVGREESHSAGEKARGPGFEAWSQTAAPRRGRR